MKLFNAICRIKPKLGAVGSDSILVHSDGDMLAISNTTIFTDLEHNACTIALLLIHVALLLWTLFSCSIISIMVSHFNNLTFLLPRHRTEILMM